MKNSLLCFLILLMMPLASMAYDFEVDGIYYKFTGSSSVAVTYKGDDPWSSDNTASYSGQITIPSTVNYNNKSYSVTSIGNSAFFYCSGLTSITIPEGVTSIGDGAFEYSGLTSITIPESVTSIGNDAFGWCSSLTSVTIPDGVTSIGSGTFSGCSSLTSITIPERATSIGDNAFQNCSGLTSITIPESVTSIGGSAFEGCSALTSVAIPKSVTSIGGYAFYGCKSLTSVTIPGSVTLIDYNAFENCSSLTSITIPEGVTSIGDGTFSGCSGLTSVLCKSKKPATCKNGSIISSSQPRLIIPIGSEEAYASATGWKEFTNRSVFKTFDHAVTTFADAQKIDLDNAYRVGDEKTFAAAATKDLKAYQFTGSAVNGTIYGTEVNGIVPAGTGLLMTGSEGATYVFPLASGDATADVSGNKLVGVTKDTDLSTLTDGNSHYVYDNDGFQLQSTGTIAANEAYLSLPTSGTEKINVSLGGASTGIKDIAADNEDNGAWYTLDGVKVNEKPTVKGLYIHHGKKVVVNK